MRTLSGVRSIDAAPAPLLLAFTDATSNDGCCAPAQTTPTATVKSSVMFFRTPTIVSQRNCQEWLRSLRPTNTADHCCGRIVGCYFLDPTALFQGVTSSVVGLIIIGLSGKIARMPREHKELFLRLSPFGETALRRLFERDRFIQFVRRFWIFCGLLWLVSGLIILLNLSPPIHLPVAKT